MNWGYFIIGLPGETEATIRETIDFAKKLPLDIALFHVAAPYPGTPFFFEVVMRPVLKVVASAVSSPLIAATAA